MHYVWDDRGRRYVDAHAGFGVAFLGHSNPKIVGALVDQALKIVTVPLSFRIPLEEELVRALEGVAPKHTEVFLFQNSGTEAVELALKLAWTFTGRRKLIAFRGAFHGRTLGSLSVTWEPKYRNGFPVLSDVVFLEYNASASVLEEHVDESTAAVIVEPVQGEGGLTPATTEFLQALEKLTKKAGALLIVDEIQCGFGRTGYTWAYEEHGIRPDIVVAGKAIGGGFPVSLVFTREEIAKALLGGRHGSTFAANPLAQAAVKASAEVFVEDSVPARVRQASEKLWRDLEARVSKLGPVRRLKGKGLMFGVELRFPPSRVLGCLQEQGVLALRAGATAVRFLPPYTIDDESISRVVDALEECICREHSC
uniref:Aspartate aminotransferase family protein n=1 Tax=Fervidicoccus fontis TaxID=683846 RepID=A0A7J3ZIP7_9CREN